jgi:hypothetical protein
MKMKKTTQEGQCPTEEEMAEETRLSTWHPIEDRNLAPGTRLVGRYHKQEYHAAVVEGETGGLRYRLDDGREFKSPSAAGSAITGKACNGWRFWGVADARNGAAVLTGN